MAAPTTTGHLARLWKRRLKARIINHLDAAETGPKGGAGHAATRYRGDMTELKNVRW
jgi:hypothetical protein